MPLVGFAAIPLISTLWPGILGAGDAFRADVRLDSLEGPLESAADGGGLSSWAPSISERNPWCPELQYRGRAIVSKC